MGHKSHDPYFHVFLMEAGVMTFVAHCTAKQRLKQNDAFIESSLNVSEINYE